MSLEKAYAIIGEINSYISLDYDNMQDWNTIFSNWQQGEKKTIGGTSKTMVVKDNNHIRFITEVPPGGSFHQHFHDCKEVCTVIGGIMADKDKPGRIWKKGEIYELAKFVKHTPYNPSQTDKLYLLIDFHK